jgi:hypothetical protein
MGRDPTRDPPAPERETGAGWCVDAPARRGSPPTDYDRTVRSLPTILLILSFPAGAIAYVVAARILGALPLDPGLRDFLVLLAPLFFAGLVMLPFLIPFFDRKAKADLAEHRRTMESTDDHADGPTEPDEGKVGQ